MSSYRDSPKKCAEYGDLLAERFRHFDSYYPKMFTAYLKNAIASCSARFTEADAQAELGDLEKFIQKLPKELLLEDFSPAVQQVKDKISTFQKAGDKDLHIQQLNAKLVAEHASLSEESRALKAQLAKDKRVLVDENASLSEQGKVLKAQLVKDKQVLVDEHTSLSEQCRVLKEQLTENKRLLKEQEKERLAQTGALDASISNLTIKESGLKDGIAQLEEDKQRLSEELVQLQKKKEALQEETRNLQQGIDLSGREKKAKAFEQGKITFILEKFGKDINNIDGNKHVKAKEAAMALHLKLNEHAQAYERDQNKEVFIANCRKSIDAAKPALDDLGWGKKLQNLMIALWNAITPQALQSNFFKAKLTEKAEDLKTDLENVNKMGPQQL